MPFRYRLEKILNFRIMKQKEQEEAVKKAELAVRKIQTSIDKTKNNITVLAQSKLTAAHIMMENYDNYIKHLYEELDKLNEEKKQALIKLQEEKQLLLEKQKDVKILEKHRERAKDEYLEEEKKAEMKRLDEVASIKHFRKTKEIK